MPSAPKMQLNHSLTLNTKMKTYVKKYQNSGFRIPDSKIQTNFSSDFVLGPFNFNPFKGA